MEQLNEYQQNFTVTFRSLALRAFTRPPQPMAVLPRERRRVARRADLAQTPLAQRVAAAFAEVPPGRTEIKVIEALLRNPGSTSEKLSALCGWAPPYWQTHFAALCQRRAAYLRLKAPTAEEEPQFLAGVLADYCPHRRTFAFRPEVDQALRVLQVDWRT